MNESFRPRHVAPNFGNDGATDDFYDSLAKQMGEDETPPEATTSDEYRDLGAILARLLDWLIYERNRITPERHLRSTAIRTLAMAWAIDPKRFEGRSLKNICLELGISYQNTSEIVSDFSRRFGITNQFQKHDWRKGENDT